MQGVLGAEGAGIEIIGDKSYYPQILLSNKTRLHCKQQQLRISPEFTISLTLFPVIVSSLHFRVLLHIYKKAKLCFRRVHLYRDHFRCLKKKKKKARCNGNPVHISQHGGMVVQESRGEGWGPGLSQYPFL